MAFCDSKQQQGMQYKWQDPLGPTSLGPKGRPIFSATGAPQMRSTLFNYLGGSLPAMQKAGTTYASALGSAASDAGWKQASNLAGRTLAGDYLRGSPTLDRALAWQRAAARSDAADDLARIKAGYGRSGMGFSTGAQQAAQAARAAANAKAEQINASTYLQNYLAERANQQNAVNLLASATGTPLSYLGQVAGAYATPAAQAGNILGSLSSGGQALQVGSSGIYSPSTGANIMSGLGAL